MTRRRAAEIDAYLAPLPAAQRDALEHLRETIAAAAPEAEEGISYSMPAFKYRGRPVVTFLAAKNHLSLFPMGYHQPDEIEDGIAEFRVLKGTLHFTPERPIPDHLVTKIVRARIEELDARAATRGRRTSR